MAIEGFNRLKDCRHGRMLYNVNDHYVGRSLELYGEYSEGEIELFERVVRPGDMVVEVGANIGAHTVWFAKTTAPGGGAVIAFEPQRIVFQTLCANLALNHLTNVTAYQSACGESRGDIRVPVLDPNLPNNFGGVRLGGQQDASGELVPIVRLDDLSIPRCRLMKVDVEGMELEVLKGGRKTILRCMPVLYVENDREDRSDELVRFIAAIGYDLYWHRPFLFNPKNFAGNVENVFPSVWSVNMLCVPKGTKVSDLPPVDVPAGST